MGTFGFRVITRKVMKLSGIFPRPTQFKQIEESYVDCVLQSESAISNLKLFEI